MRRKILYSYFGILLAGAAVYALLLREADIGELRANMLEGWESLTDEERAAFDANFPPCHGACEKLL